MKVKEMSEKSGLKLNIQKTKIMAFGPITSWHIDGETMEIVTDFIFLGSKNTVDGDCSHEIKRLLPLGRKAMANLDSILERRDIALPTKVHNSQSYSFPHSHVWMWALDHKQAECQRINAFKLWCWRRHFKVPWTPWRSNQSILKEINPEYSLEGLMLKLKLQYFGYRYKELTLWKRPWCWERLKAVGKEMTEDKMVGWHYRLNGHEFAQALGDCKGQGSLQSMGLQNIRHDWVTGQQQRKHSYIFWWW